MGDVEEAERIYDHLLAENALNQVMTMSFE